MLESDLISLVEYLMHNINMCECSDMLRATQVCGTVSWKPKREGEGKYLALV